MENKITDVRGLKKLRLRVKHLEEREEGLYKDVRALRDRVDELEKEARANTTLRNKVAQYQIDRAIIQPIIPVSHREQVKKLVAQICGLDIKDLDKPSGKKAVKVRARQLAVHFCRRFGLGTLEEISHCFKYKNDDHSGAICADKAVKDAMSLENHNEFKKLYAVCEEIIKAYLKMAGVIKDE